MMPALYAEQGLCNGGTSVSPSVSTIDYQQRPAGFLLCTLWAGDISWQQWARCRCGAAGASAQQQMWTVSHSQMMEEPEHRLVWFVGSLCVVFHRTVTFNTDTHTRLMALCPWLPGWAGTRKVKPIWIYWSKRQWVVMASAGPYASLHLAPDR